MREFKPCQGETLVVPPLQGLPLSYQLPQGSGAARFHSGLCSSALSALASRHCNLSLPVKNLIINPSGSYARAPERYFLRGEIQAVLIIMFRTLIKAGWKFMLKNDWNSHYDFLNNYIINHSEITINKDEISIPIEVRDEFCRLFDNTRKAVADNLFSTLPVDVEQLSVQYIKLEKEILELLHLDSIAMPVDLSTFLHNPKDGMVRVLYSGLFDLLQKKITLDIFEENARSDFQTVSTNLYHLGYEYWAALSFIKLLEPEKAFRVDLDYDDKPFLTELKSIAFGGQAHHATIRVPEFVIYSRKVEKYLAFKMALAREIASYKPLYIPPRRPTRPTGDTSMSMDSRSMIISILSDPEKIPILAEVYDQKITSPDIVIEFATSYEAADRDTLGCIQQRLDILQPKMGVCLLVMDLNQKNEQANLSDSISSFEIGLNESHLDSVAALLA
jgi:hypothetical protein